MNLVATLVPRIKLLGLCNSSKMLKLYKSPMPPYVVNHTEKKLPKLEMLAPGSGIHSLTVQKQLAIYIQGIMYEFYGKQNKNNRIQRNATPCGQNILGTPKHTLREFSTTDPPADRDENIQSPDQGCETGQDKCQPDVQCPDGRDLTHEQPDGNYPCDAG